MVNMLRPGQAEQLSPVARVANSYQAMHLRTGSGDPEMDDLVKENIQRAFRRQDVTLRDNPDNEQLGNVMRSAYAESAVELAESKQDVLSDGDFESLYRNFDEYVEQNPEFYDVTASMYEARYDGMPVDFTAETERMIQENGGVDPRDEPVTEEMVNDMARQHERETNERDRLKAIHEADKDFMNDDVFAETNERDRLKAIHEADKDFMNDDVFAEINERERLKAIHEADKDFMNSDEFTEANKRAWEDIDNEQEEYQSLPELSDVEKQAIDVSRKKWESDVIQNDLIGSGHDFDSAREVMKDYYATRQTDIATERARSGLDGDFGTETPTTIHGGSGENTVKRLTGISYDGVAPDNQSKKVRSFAEIQQEKAILAEMKQGNVDKHYEQVVEGKNLNNANFTAADDYGFDEPDLHVDSSKKEAYEKREPEIEDDGPEM